MEFLKKVFKSLWGKKETAPVAEEIPSPAPQTTAPPAVTIASPPLEAPETAVRVEEGLVSEPVLAVEEAEEERPALDALAEVQPEVPPEMEIPPESPISQPEEVDHLAAEPSIQDFAALIGDETVGAEAEDEDEWGDFDAAFDRAFGGVAAESAETGEAGVLTAPAAKSAETGALASSEIQEVQDLFAAIAANYARPLKSFIHELRRGPVIMDWIDICRPALESIRKAAEKMDFQRAAQTMNDFNEALSLAQNKDERLIANEQRDLILVIYDEMTRVLPQTFTIREEEHLREAIIINSLLKQIPEVGRVSMDKLYGVGLTSLDAMYAARSEDLAVTTGIPIWLCDKICVKFREFRAEIEDGGDEDAKTVQLRRMTKLLGDLRTHHEGFEQAAALEWTQPEMSQRKRQCRQARQETALQVNILLAEMDELDMVESIQKMPFDERIRVLEAMLVRRGAEGQGLAETSDQ